MLPLRLEQIKNILETKKSSRVLSKEELDLLKEITFLEKNEGIQTQILISGQSNPVIKILKPSPERCPACGRKFNK